MSQERHPGINMHKFTVGSGFVGFLFAGGCALIFVPGTTGALVFRLLQRGLRDYSCRGVADHS